MKEKIMQEVDVKKKIKTFLEEHLLVDFKNGIDESTNLFEVGLIDSYGYMELVKFLEGEFLIQFSNAELISSSFTSLSNLVKIVEEKSHAAA